ncbi:MAG: FAD-dependent monooxygenase [Woeseia sp.]
MKRQYDIAVVGAGAVGLAITSLLARLPQQASLRISLIDAAAPAPFGSDAPCELRVSAIAAGSMNMLSALGVRDLLGSRCCPYRDMRVWDAAGDAFGSDALHFAAAEVALGELGYIVEDSLLRHALYTTLPDDAVECRFGAGISRVTRVGQQLEISLQDDTTVTADLLIAADGARSAVREQLGINVDGWQYPQSAVVTHAVPERAHRHTAWQRFLADGPIALLPLADGRVSIVWSTAPDHARKLLDADDAAFSSELTAASDAVLGKLTVAAPRVAFPLRAQHAQQYVQRAVALIGDAAHTVHPLAGQGANLGLADAAALARVIGEALAAGEHPADLPVLRRYERERRGANAAMLQFIDGLNRLFATGAGLSDLRQAGMRLFNSSGPLKRQAMQVAIGL